MRCLLFLLCFVFCCLLQANHDFLDFSLSGLDADVAHFKSLPIPEFQQAAQDYQSLARSGRFSPDQLIKLKVSINPNLEKNQVPKNSTSYKLFLNYLRNYHFDAYLTFDKKQKKDLFMDYQRTKARTFLGLFSKQLLNLDQRLNSQRDEENPQSRINSKIKEMLAKLTSVQKETNLRLKKPKQDPDDLRLYFFQINQPLIAFLGLHQDVYRTSH